MKRKKLLIDANMVASYYLSGKDCGVARTTRELIQALDKAGDLPFDIELYSQCMKRVRRKNLGTHFKWNHLYFPGRFAPLLAKFPVWEWTTGCDLIHVPQNFDHVYKPEHCVVTMHDAMFYTHPGVNAQFMRENYTPLAQRSRAVITCSEYSKRDIAEYMDVKEENIFVCPWGYDSEAFHPRDKVSNRFTGEAPFFLSVSCDTGRKNTISLIRAYMAFAVNNPDHHLILVWGNAPEEYKEMVEKAGLKDKIHFAGGVGNTELAQLYSSATATFFPSKYEGFGLPILESMASGTPVVTCRNSSLPEVGGEAALYVEPEDIEAMSHLMEEFENGNIPLPQLKEKCLKQASLFSWTDCAKKTIDVYKRCLGL